MGKRKQKGKGKLVSLCTPFLQNLHLTEEMKETETQRLDDVLQAEDIIAYKFNNPHLLRQAFTHSSFQGSCASYERLEYLGDSVLNQLIAKEHYFSYPDLPPGKLTNLRSANVDTEKLARVTIKYNLHHYLRHKMPFLNGQVEELRDATFEYPLHSVGLLDPPKVLADIVESLIAAIYIDSNFSMDTTWQVVRDLLQPLITPANLNIHPATKFNEICQKNGLKTEFVDLWEKIGEFKVFVDGKFVGKGHSDKNKTIAKTRAASNAYYEVVKNLSVEATIDDDHLCDEMQS